MDARQRLNQLRRFKSKINRNKVIRSNKRLTDLRELIHRNDNKSIKTNKNNRNSVKSRIGFKTKTNNQTKRRQLTTIKQIGRRDNRKQNKKRVILDNEQRLPTVVVNFPQTESSGSLPSSSRVGSQSLFSSGSRASLGPLRRPKATNESKNSVLVSNLNETISDSDIKELFGEIGPIVRSSKINTSVALIVYDNEMDARKACQTYHNRLLDGMPMQCNTLSLSGDEYAIETQPKSQAIHSPTTLLSSQLRQINSVYTPRPIRGRPFNKRSNRSNTRFVVNV